MSKSRKVLIIPRWDEHFENAQSRQYASLAWVPFPNAHDGNGFRRIVAMGDPESSRIFSAFVLMIEVASKCPVRGVLWDKGEPITAEDLAFKTGFPKALFEDAIPVLMDRKIGWIAWGKMDGNSPDAATSSTLSATSSTLSRKGKKGKERKERKEQKEPKEGDPADLSVEDYQDIKDPTRDPISLAFMICDEQQDPRLRGFYAKTLKSIGDKAFRDCLCELFGELKVDKIKKPGAVLVNKLKARMEGGKK